MSHLFAGATVVLRRFDPERFATLVRRDRRDPHLAGADAIGALPRSPAARSDPRLARLQAIYVGGSRIPPAVFERALQTARTEDRRALRPDRSAGDLLSAAARARCRRGASRPAHSFGRAALPDYEVRLAGSDERASAGSAGEVLIRGGNVMAGYWQDEDATRAALRDGWLQTGDIGEFDDAGNLSIVGRLKDVIRSGSSTIMPKEVEDVIAAASGGRRGRGARPAGCRMGRGGDRLRGGASPA